MKMIADVIAAATPGPWWSDESDLAWRLHGNAPGWPGAPGTGPNHQILKAPKVHPDQAPYWPNAADAEYIVTMGPTRAAEILLAGDVLVALLLGFPNPCWIEGDTCEFHGVKVTPSGCPWVIGKDAGVAAWQKAQEVL